MGIEAFGAWLEQHTTLNKQSSNPSHSTLSDKLREGNARNHCIENRQVLRLDFNLMDNSYD